MFDFSLKCCRLFGKINSISRETERWLHNQHCINCMAIVLESIIALVNSLAAEIWVLGSFIKSRISLQIESSIFTH